LLEHVVSLLRLCRFAAGHYPFIDRDLLTAGAVLHDLGKIYELRYERSFTYTTEGRLLGHITMLLNLLQERAAAIPGFPPKLKTLLEHVVLSHHGCEEFGSPKRPMIPEALLLHHLDNLDSKMEAMRAALAGDRNLEGCWTSYNAALETMVLKKDKFLADPPAEPAGQPASTQEPDDGLAD
jgi:3'-5' exoribonuclease